MSLQTARRVMRTTQEHRTLKFLEQLDAHVLKINSSFSPHTNSGRAGSTGGDVVIQAHMETTEH